MFEQVGTARRSFIAGALGAGGILVLRSARGGIALAQTDPTVCASPIPFKTGMDTRPITERRTVVQLAADATWMAQMQTGYAAMRNFNRDDPRSLNQQGAMHNLMCQGGSKEVHESDRFLAWHRCFVYFQERIVSSNIHYSGSGSPTPQPPDPTFRLAMWNWEGSGTPVFPSAFTTGALNDPNRANNPGTFYAGEGDVNPALISPTNEPFKFYGYPVGQGAGSAVLENGPHGDIHISTGLTPRPHQDMGSLTTAALDPVFCAHHGNIDRVWAWWQGLHNNVTPNSIDPQTQQPYDPAWIQNVWFFTDWDGKCYSITPAEVIDYSNSLRYMYAPPPTPRPLRSLALTITGSALKAPSNVDRKPAKMVLNAVRVPAPATGRFNLVANVGGKPERVGRFSVFAMDSNVPVVRNVLATITPTGIAALRAGAPLSVVPVQSSTQALLGPGRAPLQVNSATLLVE